MATDPTQTTTLALCQEAGVSRPSALKWLGPREKAQAKYQAALATAERNRRFRHWSLWFVPAACGFAGGVAWAEIMLRWLPTAMK